MNDVIRLPEMRKYAVESIKSLSDPHYQRTVWGKVDEGSTFYDDLTETLHGVYDDTTVLQEPVSNIGWILYADEVEVLAELEKVLTPLIDELRESPDEVYLQHPKWEQVIKAAAAAYQVMARNDRPQAHGQRFT